MRVVFMGTPKYAQVVLKSLYEANFEIVLVITQPDKPVGRKGVLTPPEVKKFILQDHSHTPFIQPNSLKDSEIFKTISDAKPDYIVVAAYGKILPPDILDIAPCINLHASILPEFRGASPIQSMLLRGDEYIGVTAMRMAKGLDDGDMLGFSFEQNLGFDASEAFEILSLMAGNLCVKVLNKFAIIKPLRQINALKSHCKKIKKEDGCVKFDDNVKDVWQKFKAFSIWPGIFLPSGLKIVKIKEFRHESSIPGVISKIVDEAVCVGFKGGVLEIQKFQEPSKAAIGARDFINGKRLKIGDRIC